jgi:hypothetical protein
MNDAQLSARNGRDFLTPLLSSEAADVQALSAAPLGRTMPSRASGSTRARR